MRKNVFIISISIMAIMLSGCWRSGDDGSDNETEIRIEQIESGTENETELERELQEPIRLAIEDYDITNIQNNEWTVESLYQKDATYLDTQYVIDSEGQLWTAGYNDYGQLGIGTKIDNYDICFEESLKKVFDHVKHVSFSGEYFAAFVTTNNELYGMGANLDGVMCMQKKENDDSNPWRTVSSSPRLLMSDVKYAVCSDRRILALKSDNSVWILGRKEDKSVPRKVMDEAKLIVAGNDNYGIITNSGDLWLWGENSYGQCAVADYDYVDYPKKVAEDVMMCWFPRFKNQTIIKKENGSIEVCGYGIGEKTKTVDVFSDLAEKREITYSDRFLPVIIE